MSQDDLTAQLRVQGCQMLDMRDRIADLQMDLAAARARELCRTLMVEDIRITLCEDPDRIAMDRDGEGGEFSLREFADVLHRFISERL